MTETILYPQLIAVTGPLRGATIQLSDEQTFLGRGTANQICIADPLLSRRHCVLTRVSSQEFVIEDGGSINGTYVNGCPIKKQTLKHGDWIGVGESFLLVVCTDQHDQHPDSLSVQLDDSQIATNAPIWLNPKEAVYLNLDRELTNLVQNQQLAKNLQTLLKFSQSLIASQSLPKLYQRIVEAAFEIVPAQRGILLLLNSRTNELETAFAQEKGEVAPAQTINVSQTVIRQILDKRQGLVISDVKAEEHLHQAQSLVNTEVKAVLGVPVIAFDRLVGVLYLDSFQPDASFHLEQLQLITAIASIGGMAIDKAQQVESLIQENQRLQADVMFSHSMVGESPKMQTVFQRIAKIAPTPSTVLILGESGTGKELAARATHLNSSRSAKPFIAINCAVLGEHLLESDLFGHEKGAFTGAIALKKGKFEIADGGTLFLDEIGELGPGLQAKLLRFLQEREFERVGGINTIKVDVRIIAATNRQLEEAVTQGTFRQDLYYRLNVISLTMPPLRERQEDILLLANYFTAKYSRAINWRVNGLSPEASQRLLGYEWPGNVRELQNAIERAVVMTNTNVILAEDLPETIIESVPQSDSGETGDGYHDAVSEFKRKLIIKAVADAGGNYTEAGKLLGLHPNYLHRLIRNLNIKDQLTRNSGKL